LLMSRKGKRRSATAREPPHERRAEPMAAQASFRYVASSGALMLMIGFALAGHASGQPEPLRPHFDETPAISPVSRRRSVRACVAARSASRGTTTIPAEVSSSWRSSSSGARVSRRFPSPWFISTADQASPLTVYADHQGRTPYAPSRDVILVDQRGTGRSEPDLCADLDGAFLDAAVAVATDATDDALAKRLAAYSSCRAEAAARGFDLKDLGTSVTVADFEWVRRALGVERWNVYGESYGTTVAMTLVALNPDTVRSAVLDSIYPPDPRPMQSTNVADALFRYCAGDQATERRCPGSLDRR
jgi:hypothetical protein